VNAEENHTNSNISYYLSYDSEYAEIYESSYGMNFVFVDEDEEEQDYDLDSIFPPDVPTGLC
jgi:hypothetical protein